MIELHEDAAGGLYLRRQGDDVAYAGVQHAEGAVFLEDAAAMAAEDYKVLAWTTTEVPLAELDRPGTHLVATYDPASRTVNHVMRPELMERPSRRYLGLEKG